MSEFEHKRSYRVGQLIQEELGKLLSEDVKDPRVGFVTVTEVRLSDDLRSARVYISVLGTAEVRQGSLDGLRAASGFLRRELTRRLQLRFAPDLSFFQDDSLDRAQRLEELMQAINKGQVETPRAHTVDELPEVRTSRAELAERKREFDAAAAELQPDSRKSRRKKRGRR